MIKFRTKSKPLIILIAGCIIAVATVIFIFLFSHEYWASFITPPFWRYWAWIIFGIYVLLLGAVIIFRIRQMKIVDGPLFWTLAGGCLMFGFAGVEATEGILALSTKYFSHVDVKYCATVTEHKLPIETFLRKAHRITIRIPSYNDGENIDFYYNRNAIDIDEVRTGDSVWITGKRASTGIYVEDISPAQCN